MTVGSGLQLWQVATLPAAFLLCVFALQSDLLSPFVASKEYQKLAIQYLFLASLCSGHLLLYITGINSKVETSSQWKKTSVSSALRGPWQGLVCVVGWWHVCVAGCSVFRTQSFWKGEGKSRSPSKSWLWSGLIPQTLVVKPVFGSLRGGGYGGKRHGPRWATFGRVLRGLAVPWTAQGRGGGNVRKWVGKEWFVYHDMICTLHKRFQKSVSCFWQTQPLGLWLLEIWPVLNKVITSARLATALATVPAKLI